MRRYDYPTYGGRYVGNTNTKEVHDLDNENTGSPVGWSLCLGKFLRKRKSSSTNYRLVHLLATS
jgi:hypothetical protein